MWHAYDFDGQHLASASTRRGVLAEVEPVPEMIWFRHRYGPGDYEFSAGYPGEDDVGTVYVVTTEVAQRLNWEIDITGKGPDSPLVGDVEDEAVIQLGDPEGQAGAG